MTDTGEKHSITESHPNTAALESVVADNQAGRHGPKAGDLVAANPASMGLPTAEQLLGSAPAPVWPDKDPGKDRPGYSPGSDWMRPRVDHSGIGIFKEMSLPGEDAKSRFPTTDVKSSSTTNPDGSITTSESGKLKDGYFWDTKYTTSTTVTPDGLILKRDISYQPPRELQILEDPDGTNYKIEVKQASTVYDGQSGRYVTTITDAKGQQSVIPANPHYVE